MGFLIVILVYVLICFISVYKMSKKTGFRASYIFLSMYTTFFIGMVLMPFIGLFIESFDNKQSTAKADGYTIDSYTVILDVDKNNVIQVEEDVNINFTSAYKHGIYKFTPEWLQYTSKNGKTIRRKSRVLNLEAENDDYDVDEVNKKKRIKIGSAYEYTGLGIHNYIIKYDYDMGKDPFKGYDEFIFHAYGDYWGTTINNPKIIVNMPEEITNEKISFFTDKKRKNDVTKYMDININENTIEATYNIDKCKKEKSNCDLNGALTVDIELAEGYFTGGYDNYGIGSLFLILDVIVITFVVFILWIFYGKDYEKKLKTIEYYPPYDLDAAQIGYSLNKANGKKMTIALIIELAAKGYVQIYEDKKDQYIVNLCPEGGAFAEKETYKSKVPSDIKFNNKNKLKKLTANEKIVYDNLFSSGNIEKLSTDKYFYKTFEQVYNELENNFKNKISDKKSRTIQIAATILLVFATILSLVSFYKVEDLNPAYFNLYYVSFICTGLIFLLTLLMRRKTIYGEEIIAKIKGFKEYLNEVEKDKLETLVEENPNYFYEILPYTYILNLSRKWIKKFENIPVENVNMGNFDYTNLHSLSSMADSISFPATSSSGGHSSSGCSSCGGGCSSCGGGCSSCGGGGSW